jgi:hypothetical protein
VACPSNEPHDNVTVASCQCHFEGRTVKYAVFSDILQPGNMINLGSARKLVMIVNRSEMLDPHRNWKDLLSTEWREPSTSLAYIQGRTKRITAVCFYHTESSANHLVYMDSFNSHDPCPIVRSVHEIYCFFFSFCRAFFSSCFLSICSISSASFLLAYHWPACRIKTPTSKRAKMVSLAARTLSESSLLR